MHYYFFGCWNKDIPGHYLYHQSGLIVSRSKLPKDFPLHPDALDAGFLPQKLQEERKLYIWRTNGWAIITFWDRSGDSRPGSNSAFILSVPRGFTDRELVLSAHNLFPEIFNRLVFPLVLPSGQRYPLERI